MGRLKFSKAFRLLDVISCNTRSCSHVHVVTGSTGSGAEFDVRRRRIRFRAWHRGIREMDLIMGRFADAAIAGLSETETADFEHLMEVPDHDVLAWLTGAAALPARYDTPLYRRLKRFHMGYKI